MRGWTVPLHVLFTLPLLTAAAAPSEAPQIHRIEIKDLSFGPSPAGVRRGDTVEWINHDILLHSVTANDGSFDADIAPGKTLRIVMRNAGSIPYFCKYHPGMKAILTVSG